ncbi:AraC family transcriptional regulator [Actinorhabdospora filicis]|uniref:AraC family transcriptional regulator n=1 Tax=Actinorhabdospora filicis TaxID=1785913 RepID=A0A9W6SDF6_9ACTN|nr:helix-turn-helix domain-containing protein [Actinorhabdospora filicis]GLZ75209.1 AraC family transcriptional regulator [Actinorhabdospora filicis]
MSGPVAVVLFDRTPMFEDAVPIRVFGALTTVRVAAHHGGPSVTTSDGLVVSTPATLDEVREAGLVILPSYPAPPADAPDPRVLDALRAAHDAGATVVGLCLGAFVLAAAGLLDGRRATTHWAHADLLARKYPGVDVRPDELYVDEGRVLTSAGSAAGLDACLHLVRRLRGAAEANRVARTLVVAPHRDGGQAQYVEHPVPRPRHGDPIGDVMAHLLADLAAEHHVDDLAARARMSRRSFDRHFRQATGTTPAQWLRHQRLLAAQRLLEETGLPVEAVARRCGYPSAAALRPHFAGVFGVSPASYRRTFRVPAG